MAIKVEYQVVDRDHGADSFMLEPQRATDGAAGFDLRADVRAPVVLPSWLPVKVKTGIRVAIPPGYVGEVRPRSSMAAKGIIIPNAPGTIDSDFRGEIEVILMRICRADGADSIDSRTIRPGDRIAQLVIEKIPEVEMQEVDKLDETERGDGGFGSTGR